MAGLKDSPTFDISPSAEVIRPGEAGYDVARQLWNAANDLSPAIIVRCTSAENIQAAVLEAVRSGLEIAVRGGGHSFPGYSCVNDGLMIDLSRMNGVVVDPTTRRARVQGGALLRDLDTAAYAHGLAVPAGMVSHTGVGGLTLGGGMGYLSRLHGLSIDNLISAEIVLADGRITRVDEQHEPDLFWAIRGGGGNFGVVSEFEFQLHPLPPLVDQGLFFWSLDQGVEALRLMNDLIADSPLALNPVPLVGITAPPAPFVPEPFHGMNGCALSLVGVGDSDAFAAAVERVRTTLPPAFDAVAQMPYPVLQTLIDEPNAPGSFGYDKGVYLSDLDDQVASLLVEHAARKTSPLSAIPIYRLDGAYSEVADDATAFSGPRTPCYFANLIGLAPIPGLFDEVRSWVRALADDLQPHALAAGSYVNVLPDDASGVRDSYGAKFARLQRIKAQYDPDNVFHRNANVPPARPVEA